MPLDPSAPRQRLSDRIAHPHAPALDFDALLGRLLSSSYAPREDQAAHESMVTALRGLFDRCVVNRRVAMLYDT